MMKRILLLTVLLQGIYAAYSQSADSSLADLNDKQIDNLQSISIQGTPVKIDDYKLRGTISISTAFRYRDRIYVVGTTEKTVHFTILLTWQSETFNSKVFILEYDTNINLINKYDIDIAGNGKEYITDNISFNQTDNKLLYFFSVKNRLRRKKILMVSSFDLESKKTRTIKLSEMPINSKDNYHIVQDKSGASVIVDYMMFDKDANKLRNVASVRIDKDLNMTESSSSTEDYEKVFVTYTDDKTGSTYEIIRKDGIQQLAIHQNSRTRYHRVSFHPENDEILNVDFDNAQQVLFLTIHSKSKKFTGYCIHSIAITNDSIRESRISYIRETDLNSMDVFKKIQTDGYKEVTYMDEKQIEKLKKYYYRQTSVFDHTTKTLLLFHTLHREYTTVVREETKHYRTDRNGRQYYTHSTFRDIYKDRYVNGPVVMTQISSEGSTSVNTFNLMHDLFVNLPVEIKLTRSGPGKVHLVSFGSVFIIDLLGDKISRFNAVSSMGKIAEDFTILPLDNDFLVLQHNKLMFKMSLVKAIPAHTNED